MGIIYLSIWAICVLILVGIYQFVKRYFADEPKIVKATFWIVLLIPTYDIILTFLLGGIYCLTTNSTYIHKKVEYPISIYWEDNVYPGFSKDDRELMILNYLDGIHLKTMALNAPDGKTYVYHCQKDKQLYEKAQKEKQQIEQRVAELQKRYYLLRKEIGSLISTKKIYNQEAYEKLPKSEKEKMIHLYNVSMISEKIRDKWHHYVKNTKDIQAIRKRMNQIIAEKKRVESTKPNYFPNFTQQCKQSERIFTKATMPKTNYTVTFNEAKLNLLSRYFLYSDETDIIENKTGKIIAHNQRFMPFKFNAYFFIDEHQYYLPFAICGERFYREFDGKVFSSLQYMYGGEVTNSKGLNEVLYDRYIKKGEK